MIYKMLGDIIAAKKTSQTELAHMMGRSVPYLSKRMNGHAAFDLDDIYAICDILGIRHENIPLVFPDRRKYRPVDVTQLLTVAGGGETE